MILASEIDHFMNQNRGVRGIVGIKLDMQKAYDRVDWVVLTRILTLFEFPDKSMKLILNCILTASIGTFIEWKCFLKNPYGKGA